MRVVYLTGDRVHIRPLVDADKQHAIAWFNSVFPANEARVDTFLEKQVYPYWEEKDFTLLIARVGDDRVIGSVQLSVHDWRIATLRFHMAPLLDDADALRAAALQLLVPWLRNEHEMMVTRLYIPADQPQTIAAAEQLGMTLSVRLREFIAVAGGRTDELTYEVVNPHWEVPIA